MRLLRMVSCVSVVCLVLFSATLTGLAQKPVNAAATVLPAFPGKYQGVSKTAKGDEQITLRIVEDAGKFSGQLGTPQGQFEIVKGQIADGVLSLDLDQNGSPARLSLRWREDKLVGELSRAGQAGPVELKKIDEFSGDWEAIANINDQNYPFTLNLKVDGDKVTGGSSSEIGNASITKGVVKDGKLFLELLGTSGAVIVLDATLKDGNLIGSIDFNGLAQGSWVAVRRK
jgi:hypothetical protein